MNTSPQQPTSLTPPDNSLTPPDNGRGKLKGIRMRKWGKWVSEVRIPKSRAKIWLGSYNTPEQAARAYDAAVYCLRGPNAKFNFPNFLPAIPSASSLSIKEIQVAAAKYALDQIPSTTPNNNVFKESVSPSTSSVSEMEASSNGQLMFEEQEMSFWDSLFGDEDGNQCLEKLPSLDGTTLELTSSTSTEDQGYLFFDTAQLWEFLSR